MPDGIDETWRGVVFGGEFELGDIFTTADPFKMASDKLVEIAHKTTKSGNYFNPLYTITGMQQNYISNPSRERRFTTICMICSESSK